MSTIVKTLLFPEKIIEDIQPLIIQKNTNFTTFVMSAIETYIKSIQFSNSLNKSFGSWKSNEHSELNEGSDSYIRKMRKGRKNNGVI